MKEIEKKKEEEIRKECNWEKEGQNKESNKLHTLKHEERK